MCGRTSEVPVGAINVEEVETRSRSPLVWYEFSNGLTDSPIRFSIYSKEADLWHRNNPTFERVVETVLNPSGLWRESSGKVAYVNVDSRLDENLACFFPSD
jgi:hypothetical protein